MHTTKLQTLKHFFFMDRNTKGMKKIFMVDPYTFSYQMLQNKNSYLPNNCATDLMLYWKFCYYNNYCNVRVEICFNIIFTHLWLLRTSSWNSTIFDTLLLILQKIILTLRIGGNWDSSHCSSNCMFFWRFDEFFACVLSNLKYFGIWQIAMTLSLYHE